MGSNILNPSASVTVGLRGLAVCCHNKTFNDNRGRWEIAIPRFSDHVLSLEITGVGNFFIEPQVRFIEIKDRGSIAVEPTHEVGEALNRTDPEKNAHDFRWVTDFSNELPHKILSIVTKEQNPERVDVTMLYVYDAISYTKSIDSSMLIRPEQKKTGPVVGGRATKLPETDVIPVLESTEEFIFEAGMMGMDIRSSGGDAVDILFDRTKTITIPHGIKPQQIVIQNLEAGDQDNDDRFLGTSEKFHFGLGDLFRYYELFNVDGEKVDQWGKQPKDSPEGPNKNCCCNKVRVSLANLDALLL